MGAERHHFARVLAVEPVGMPVRRAIHADEPVLKVRWMLARNFYSLAAHAGSHPLACEQEGERPLHAATAGTGLLQPVPGVADLPDAGSASKCVALSRTPSHVLWQYSASGHLTRQIRPPQEP